MDTQDRRAIEQLFDRLAEVEKTAAPRDADSDALIRDLIAQRPQAAYYMAQTIIMQQKALEEAERRLQSSEGYDSFNHAPEDDGTSGRMRNSGSGIPQSGKRFSIPAAAGHHAQAAPQAQAQGGGGGFLAGAAQTAVGVAGGVLLGSAIGGMLGMGGSQPAAAAEAAEKPEPAAQEAEPAETEMADAGADNGEGGGGFWDSLFGGGGDGDGSDIGGGDY